MTQAFTEALTTKTTLEAAVDRASAALKDFPRLPNGLTPDATKASPEYQQARQRYDAAFRTLRAFNRAFLKTYAREYRTWRVGGA